MAENQLPDIGKYKIIELVGEGAMGVVYRARDSVLDRSVAIKVMNESIARQDDLRRRFLHEAQAAASLQHPNVVTIFDLGDADGHLFIAMEFVEGIDLEKLMESGQLLSLQARLDIITEDPKPVSALMPNLPRSFDAIVQKAMAKDPKDRYVNALVMANELSAVRAKLSGPAYPESVSLSASVSSAIEQARKKAESRSRNFMIAGLAALAAVVLLIIWSEVGRPRAANPAVASQHVT